MIPPPRSPAVRALLYETIRLQARVDRFHARHGVQPDTRQALPAIARTCRVLLHSSPRTPTN